MFLQDCEKHKSPLIKELDNILTNAKFIISFIFVFLQVLEKHTPS